MSTTQLIFIVMLVCTLCIISLWAAQLKRQKAIEKARNNIIYTAQIMQLHQIIEATATYLDDPLIQFLANRIDYSAKLLTRYKITPDKRCQHIIEQAQEWAIDPKMLRKQAQKEKPESQQKILSLLKSIIQHIRQGVMEHKVSRDQANQLAHATQFSKIKLNCYHHQQMAKEALKTGELKQGIDILKKVKALLERVSPLPADLQQQLIECQDLIDNTQQILKKQNETSSSNYLEEAFDKEEEQDQEWKKKKLYD
jgi:hypothetical protein